MKQLRTLIVIAFISASSASAWEGPTAAPPGNNALAPIHVGPAQQFKPGIIGANIINIYGSAQYLNFGNSTGASGFGIRNNAGILEYKNSGGTWASIASGTNPWTATGSDIHFTGGNVGLGLADPTYALDVSGSARISGTLLIGKVSQSTAGTVGTYASSAASSCPAGTVIVSGGCHETNAGCWLYRNYPGSTTAWQCNSYSTAGAGCQVYAYSICARIN